ncbi:MAG TPA: LysM peptidoglycan-binding domain-containing protein [Verrucomicrobiae bacterium]|jgi:LysM repeat protein|nr:LysM peptidoglycan-binding domain-containing protein [Verrucomicrobiae bacterium]
MNNSSPLIPQGTLLEQQNKGRARFKVAVLCVLGFHVLLFGGVLMLGCKREAATASQDTQSNPGSTDTTMSAATTPSNNDTTTAPSGTGNPASTPSSTTPPIATTSVPPAATTTVPPATTTAVPTGSPSDYTLAKGDTYSSIGKKFGVSIKALEAANPTMPPTKLMPGKKIQIPAPTTVAAAAVSTVPGMAAETSDVYVVKSGDSLTAIAHGHSTSVKALMAANNLTTTRIRVGDKLHLPAPKASTPPAVPADSTATPTSATSVPPLTAPAATLR